MHAVDGKAFIQVKTQMPKRNKRYSLRFEELDATWADRVANLAVDNRFDGVSFSVFLRGVQMLMVRVRFVPESND
eukprot:6179635-Pleurochrysis_carterae.AAC.2